MLEIISKNLVRVYCWYAVDANLFRLTYSPLSTKGRRDPAKKWLLRYRLVCCIICLIFISQILKWLPRHPLVYWSRGPFPTYGHADPHSSSSPGPPSEVMETLWKMRSVPIVFMLIHLNFQVCRRPKKNVLKVTKFTGKMSNGLKRMKNPFTIFCDF